MGRQHVGDGRAAHVARGDGAGQVVAAVQVGDVEVPRVLPHPPLEAERHEELLVVRDPVGEVGKEVHAHTPRHAGRRQRHAGHGIARIRGADGDVVAPTRESARDIRGHPRDAAVRPGALVVRRDVKDAQARHGQSAGRRFLARDGGGRAAPALAADARRAEAECSRLHLERLLGRAVTAFAYPFGHVDDAAVTAVVAAGYARAVTCQSAAAPAGCDLLRLPRVEVRVSNTQELERLLVAYGRREAT